MCPIAKSASTYSESNSVGQKVTFLHDISRVLSQPWVKMCEETDNYSLRQSEVFLSVSGIMATTISNTIPVHSAGWCWKSSIMMISFGHSLSQSSLGCEWCRSGPRGLYRIWSRRISSAGRRCSRVGGLLLHVLPAWAAHLQPYLGNLSDNTANWVLGIT